MVTVPWADNRAGGGAGRGVWKTLPVDDKMNGVIMVMVSCSVGLHKAGTRLAVSCHSLGE